MKEVVKKTEETVGQLDGDITQINDKVKSLETNYK